MDLCPRTNRIGERENCSSCHAAPEHFRSILLQLQQLLLPFSLLPAPFPFSHFPSSPRGLYNVQKSERNRVAIDCGCAKFLIMFAVSNWISFSTFRTSCIRSGMQDTQDIQDTQHRTPDGHKYGLPFNYFNDRAAYIFCPLSQLMFRFAVGIFSFLRVV